MDSDTTIRRTAVMDFIGHTEQVLENNIFWSKIDSGFRDTASTYWIPKTGQQIFFFFFLETTMSNQTIVWVGQTRKIVGNTLCQYLKYIGHVCHCPNTMTTKKMLLAKGKCP